MGAFFSLLLYSLFKQAPAVAIVLLAIPLSLKRVRVYLLSLLPKKEETTDEPALATLMDEA